VAFTENGERLIGDAAKNQLTLNPENTIFDAKRLIGREFTDKTVQDDMKLWPFGVFFLRLKFNFGGFFGTKCHPSHSPKIFQVADKSNKPHIKANVNGEIKQFAPEEISAMVLGKMKEIAEAYLGHEVTHAVVTVSNFIVLAI